MKGVSVCDRLAYQKGNIELMAPNGGDVTRWSIESKSLRVLPGGSSMPGPFIVGAQPGALSPDMPGSSELARQNIDGLLRADQPRFQERTADVQRRQADPHRMRA
ncbi:MAG: hypothetical protein AB7E24_21090 [Novosphingobium sp.]